MTQIHQISTVDGKKKPPNLTLVDSIHLFPSFPPFHWHHRSTLNAKNGPKSGSLLISRHSDSNPRTVWSSYGFHQLRWIQRVVSTNNGASTGMYQGYIWIRYKYPWVYVECLGSCQNSMDRSPNHGQRVSLMFRAPINPERALDLL